MHDMTGHLSNSSSAHVWRRASHVAYWLAFQEKQMMVYISSLLYKAAMNGLLVVSHSSSLNGPSKKEFHVVNASALVTFCCVLGGKDLSNEGNVLVVNDKDKLSSYFYDAASVQYVGTNE